VPNLLPHWVSASVRISGLVMEIVQERLDREFNMDVINTVPNVSYRVLTSKGETIDVHNPSGLPDQTYIDFIEEPYIAAEIICQSDYVGPVMKLCIDKRGALKNQVYLTTNRIELSFEMPLAEIVFDFYDKLKSISRYAFDYHYTGYKPANLVRLISCSAVLVDALSSPFTVTMPIISTEDL
jgi:GTP-binding protein LepA